MGFDAVPWTGAPAAPGKADTPASIPLMRSARGPAPRVIWERAVSTRPALRSVESCTSAGSAGAPACLQAAISSSSERSPRRAFMARILLLPYGLSTRIFQQGRKAEVLQDGGERAELTGFGARC